MKVLIAPSSFDTSLLKDYEVIHNPYGRKLSSHEVITLGWDCTGIIAGLEEYSKDVIQSLVRLKCISRCGVGTDNIDMAQAKERGIAVRNTPSPARAVAELTVALIFNLLRGVSFCDREMRKGNWTKFTGELIQTKTVGILGCGRIGQEVENILLGGCQVRTVACDIGGDLTGLLKQSDILTIHVSGNKCLIGKQELRMMKKGACLINTSRGGVVDEQALYETLKSKHLAGAALDVFTEEPYLGKLRELDNVILTPHIGSYTRETRKEMECQAVQNLLESLT